MEIMPFIKLLPKHVQHYGVVIATMGAIIYHWGAKHIEESCDIIASIFDLAIHISDSMKDLTDEQKMQHAIIYVLQRRAGFKPWDIEYWKMRSFTSDQIRKGLEICLEAKKVGISQVLVPIIQKGLRKV